MYNGTVILENGLAVIKRKQKLNLQLTYDPEIVHLGIYSRQIKTCAYMKTCAQMFKETLF